MEKVRKVCDFNEIERKVEDIIAEILDIEKKKVTPDANLENDLGADSIDAVDILMALEKEFYIDIPDEVVDDYEKWTPRKVSDLVDELKRKGKKK